MQRSRLQDTVETHLKANPAAARIFDALGIDYCCGGARTLAEACLARGLDPAEVAGLLAELEAEDRAPGPAVLTLAELAEQIEREHQERLQGDLPRLLTLSDKVARVHGESDPRLLEVRDRVRNLGAELHAHVEKERRTVFPAVRGSDPGRTAEGDHAPLGFTLAVLRGDHEAVSDILEAIRALTDGFTPPDHACNSYIALLQGLRGLDADLARLIRLEEEHLFPGTLARPG